MDPGPLYVFFICIVIILSYVLTPFMLIRELVNPDFPFLLYIVLFIVLHGPIYLLIKRILMYREMNPKTNKSPSALPTTKSSMDTDEELNNKKWLVEERLRVTKIQNDAELLKRSEINSLRKRVSIHVDGLLSMNPREFETEVINLYRKLGYTVTQTPYTNDKGKDGIAIKDGIKYLIEAKRYTTGMIGRPALQKFFAAIYEEKAAGGFFVTTSYFTSSAKEYA